jgi:5-methylcytosine-specific restriction enzyme A
MQGGTFTNLYGSRWQKARHLFLRAHPFCVMCKRQGRIEPAAVVDHIRPHRGDAGLFWDQGNWQPLCKSHHDATKQRMEGKGAPGCGPDGLPLDQDHPWSSQIKGARFSFALEPPKPARSG